MSFDWENYVAVAEDLARGGTEAHKRAAMSRAYYGVLHKAREYLTTQEPSLDVVLRTTRIHQVVWEKLQERGRSDKELEVGVSGGKLRANRILADYRDSIRRFDDRFFESMEAARSVCQLLKELRAVSSSGGSLTSPTAT